MARLGHSSTRAAMIYQHATRDRDQAIAKTLGGRVAVPVRTCCGPSEVRLVVSEPDLIKAATCFGPVTRVFSAGQVFTFGRELAFRGVIGVLPTG